MSNPKFQSECNDGYIRFFKSTPTLGLICVKMKGQRCTEGRAKLILDKFLEFVLPQDEDLRSNVDELKRIGSYEQFYLRTVGMVQAFDVNLSCYTEDDAKAVLTV